MFLKLFSHLSVKDGEDDKFYEYFTTMKKNAVFLCILGMSKYFSILEYAYFYH